MVIIVEGPDGAGKTTLIENLCKGYKNAKVIHFGKPDNTADEFSRYAMQLISHADVDVLILDRSWYSEYVYGPLMRGKSLLDYAHIKALEALVMQQGGGHVIYCTGRQSTLWSRCKVRGETYITDTEQHKQICERYNAVINEICGLPVVVYDTTRPKYKV